MNTNDIIKNVIIVILAVLTSFFGCTNGSIRKDNAALKRELKGCSIRIENLKTNAAADKIIIMNQDEVIKEYERKCLQ